MLGFFRKYQKYFFIFVTTIIVISFSFFGVINSMGSPQIPDPVVHTTTHGVKIRKSKLEQMAYFLSTDAQDRLFFGGRKGPNFLNDGVLQKDFLASGLAEVLAAHYQGLLKVDLESKAKREKNFQLYRHPQAEFISVENAWNFIAPDMKQYFHELQNGDDPLSGGKFHARIQLYLGQRRFPPNTLKQILSYQNRQYSWVPPDPNLVHADLSVFGYKTIDDWFGPRFVRLASAVILDTAEMARKQGLSVSDDEALASLIRQTHFSYEQVKNSPYFDSVNVDDYLQQQLRFMHMDMKQAVNLWKQVLLFRLYFDSVGDSVFVDRMPYKNFADYANLTVSGNLYRLSEDMRLANFQDFQRFEFYLSAVAKRDKGNPLSLPAEFFSAEKLVKVHPEFVQKRYKISVASVDAQKFQDEVGTKEMWNWQMEDGNWALLQKTFSDLGIQESRTREERFAALNDLSRNARQKVDNFSKEMLVKENLQWVDEFLDAAKPEIEVIAIRMGGSFSPLSGIESGEILAALLDNAASGVDVPELRKYSEDSRHYYKIQLIEAAPQMDVLTFSEMKNDGTLDESLRKTLENHYEKIRENDPDKFKNPSGEWKSFADVRDLAAKDYFSDVLLAVNSNVESSDPLTVDDAARYRFKVIMENLKEAVEKDPVSSEWIAGAGKGRSDALLALRPPLIDQWKVVKTDYKLRRSGDNEEKIDRESVFALQPGQWSEIYMPPQGDISFFQLVTKEVDTDQKLIMDGITEGQHLLSNSAKKLLLEKTLSLIEEKQPIKLDYLNSTYQHAKLD